MITSKPLSILAVTLLAATRSKGFNPRRTKAKHDFCEEPYDWHNVEELELCKLEDETWLDISAEVSFHRRELTQECGPNCRPSCVTLMLDLDKLSYEQDLICSSDELCRCEHQKCSECSDKQKLSLFEEYPKCYLEDSDCLGATVFDDTFAYLQSKTSKTLPEMEDRCTFIPEDDLYCRFKDWNIVTPMKTDCLDNECFAHDRKIFFEYCNVVEEDPYCDRCNGERCARECPKLVEPFPPGWTNFVVTASIPYELSVNDKCDQVLDWEDKTETACFMQRIDIYYPLLDETCEQGCPNCHDCPLLSLGDKFGPLEVVGFGHAIDTPCAPCDKVDTKTCDRDDLLSCRDLLTCEKSVDCQTGESLGLPSFLENECSFCNAST